MSDADQNRHAPFEVRRPLDEPIIGPESSPEIGTNIQGPSVIEAPQWLADPLGRYLMYFADHKGTYIRLAAADSPEGPWRVHPEGSLQLAESGFLTEDPELSDDRFVAIEVGYRKALGDAQMPYDVREDLITPHVASPDVHVDDEQQEIRMYFHGLAGLADQQTRLAVSTDGRSFRAEPELLGPSYFRVFRHAGWWYALAMPGRLFRSVDGRTGFVEGPRLFDNTMRHCALRVVDDAPQARLEVFWTRVGDAPERVLFSTVLLDDDWQRWQVQDGQGLEMLRPQRRWEGADLALEPSRRGPVNWPVNQLRDPALLEADGRTLLYYAVAGESGIGMVELQRRTD
jgi:hypothetical protein